jgi:hypothetical protein
MTGVNLVYDIAFRYRADFTKLGELLTLHEIHWPICEVLAHAKNGLVTRYWGLVLHRMSCSPDNP